MWHSLEILSIAVFMETSWVQHADGETNTQYHRIAQYHIPLQAFLHQALVNFGMDPWASPHQQIFHWTLDWWGSLPGILSLSPHPMMPLLESSHRGGFLGSHPALMKTSLWEEPASWVGPDPKLGLRPSYDKLVQGRIVWFSMGLKKIFGLPYSIHSFFPPRILLNMPKSSNILWGRSEQDSWI